MAEMKSKKSSKVFKKKDIRDNKDKDKITVRKLYLSKAGDTNFHLWKEDMQLRIAIDYPLFAGIFENCKHTSFVTPSLETFINRERSATVDSDSESDDEIDNYVREDESDDSDNDERIVARAVDKTATNTLSASSAATATNTSATSTPTFVARVKRSKKESEEDFAARCAADISAQKEEHEEKEAAELETKRQLEAAMQAEIEALKAQAEVRKKIERDAQVALYSSYLKKTLEDEMDYLRSFVSVFSYILQSVSKESVDMLMLHKRWAKANTDKDPLKLFKLIKRVHLGTNSGVPVEIRLARVERVHNIRQGPSESLRQYKERFATTVQGVEELGIAPEPMTMLTARFIRGLSEDRHKEFKTWLANLASTVGKDQYPKTVEEAVTMISSFEAPRASYRPQSGVGPAVFTTKETKIKEPVKETRSCHHCGKKGHLIKDCWQLSKQKETALMVKDVVSDNIGDIVLDNGATVHVYRDITMVEDIRACRAVDILGVHGKLRCNQKGTCKVTGVEVLLHTDACANILSWSKLIDQGFKIEYDESDDSFTVNKQEICEVFTRTDGLYKRSSNFAFVATVRKNEAMHTANDVKGARDAISLMKRLGAPASATIKELLNSGVLGAEQVSAKDVDNAVQIYGEPLANLKGKAKEPSMVNPRLTSMPKTKTTSVDIFVDLFSWDDTSYCICVVKPIGLLMTTHLGDAKRPKSGRALLDTISYYKDVCKANGFRIRNLYMDGEKGMKSVQRDLSAMGISLVPLTGSHVGTVEVAIRTVKEQARGIVHTLPYRLPKILQKDLIAFVTQRLNMLPSKRGYVGMPAIQAFTGVRVNLDKEARVAFGEYCQTVTPNLASTSRKNDVSHARTEGCIALSNASRHGHVFFYCLRTRSRITRTKWTSLPLSGELITMINGMSAHDVAVAVDDVVDAVAVDELVDDIVDEVANDVAVEAATVDDVVSETDEAIEVHDAVDDVTNEATVEDQPVGTRRSGRASRVDYAEMVNGHKVCAVRQLEYCLNMSIKSALRKFGEAADESIRIEVNNLVDKGVLEPIHFDYSSGEKLLDCFMFIKEKLTPTGEVDKVKSRIVANEKKQFVFTDEQTSSPTATTTSLLIVAALALARGWSVATADFVAAYLNAKGGNQAMRVNQELTGYILDKKPEWKRFVNKKGGLVVRLKRALYGCSESARRWYELLTSTLEQLGYRKNPYDSCVFTSADSKVILCVYVDDMFVTAEKELLIRSLHNELLKVFPSGINFKYGDRQDYVGMHIELERVMGQVHITMEDYTKRMCEAYGGSTSRTITSPANSDLFTIDEDEERLDAQYQDIFHSTVAAALYLAKRARPDILLTVSALTSRVNKASNKDKKALERLLAYLLQTRWYIMAVSLDKSTNDDWVIKSYIDAAFALHQDGKSHTGVFISLGGGGVFFKSVRQKIVCKSAWEAELVAQSDGASQAVWTYRFCNELGAGKFKVVFLCDNMGTIASIKKGKPSNDRSRHVHTRYFWMRQLLDNPDMTLEHCKTEVMIADVLTKPLTGETFARLVDMAMGHSCAGPCPERAVSK